MGSGSGTGGIDTRGSVLKRIQADGYTWWVLRLWPFRRWLIFNCEVRTSEPLDYRE